MVKNGAVAIIQSEVHFISRKVGTSYNSKVCREGTNYSLSSFYLDKHCPFMLALSFFIVSSKLFFLIDFVLFESFVIP